MESTDQNNQGTCQGTERSPHLTNIKHLPDEVLLEIFDIYRQSIDRYDHYWRKKYAWFNLAHVCIRWRAVMFASSSRLDLNVVVGPLKPGHIKTILSGHLPIIIDYPHNDTCGKTDLDNIGIGSALWRLNAALGHRDRVREISFEWCGVAFKRFIRATNYHFPALESLVLCFPHDHKPDIPATFLRGPDQSDLRLRRLELKRGSLTSFSGLLSLVTALTDLTLSVSSDSGLSDPTQLSSFLACLQGMQCLRSLDLTTPYDLPDLFPSKHSVHKENTVAMSELTHIRYFGHPTFLDYLMSGLSAPFLQDAHFVPCIEFPCFSRVIDDVREEFRSVSVIFDIYNFYLLLSTHSGEIDRFKPSSFNLKFTFNLECLPDSIYSMSSRPSTKLAMAEELTLNLPSSGLIRQDVSWVREFLRQFRSVRILRVNPFVREVGLYLRQDDDRKAILPALEKIELFISCSGSSDEEYERYAISALTALEPWERVGRLVIVYHSGQTMTQSRNTERR